MGGYSKVINGLRAAASGAFVKIYCKRARLLSTNPRLFIHSRNRNVVETLKGSIPLRPLCFWVIFFFSKQKNKDAAPTPASVATSVQQHKEEDEETTVAVSISPQTAKMSAQVSVLTSFTHDDHGMY